jgi:hypothetical protein
MENFENKKEHNLEKPTVLYHGSSDRNIHEFTPKENVAFGGIEKGVYVFATPDKKAVLPYLFSGEINGKQISWNSGKFSDGTVYVALPVSREDFSKNDRGGVVYTISPENFHSYDGYHDYEWVSEETIIPNGMEVYESILDTWEKNNIKLYFDIDFDVLNKFRGDDKQKYLDSLS